ncbi:hypothetical protein T440DRAFT_403371, partial [Plenodomus tracheiphilus IPT5]
MNKQHLSASYRYSALRPGEIRLLEPLYKADGLAWSLRIVQLEHAQLKFDALSYVWGEETVKHPIVCNGQTLHVHANLYEAMPYLARRDTTTRPIWIDAVCVNQDDEKEKFVQIKLMNKVCRGAETVWV